MNATVSARVLLVEDDSEVQNVAKELLQDIGCQVIEARDGKSALLALDHDPAIELMMSDIVMPGGIGGLELAQVVRESCLGLPILLATGYSQYAAQVVREGFILIEKPYNRDTLAAAIREVVERTSSCQCIAKPADLGSA